VHLYLLTHIQLSMKRGIAKIGSARGVSVHTADARDRCGIGGADRDRTDDPLVANQMLSQLSYSPGGIED
jgi:hypothetical protein